MTIRIALIAEESAGLQTLKLIEQSGAELAAVLADPHARGLSTVWKTAKNAGHNPIPAAWVKTPELAARLQQCGVNLLLNVHSLYRIDPAILDVPALGAFNLHPGPLPEMAGLNVPNWAIYHQHCQHAVSVHRMTEQIDAGTIVYEDRFDIPQNSTGLNLSLECIRRGLVLIEKLLDSAIAGKPLPSRSQATNKRRYYPGSNNDTGIVNLHRSADQILAHLRASNYRPFTSAWGHPLVHCEAGEIGLVDGSILNNVTNKPGLVTAAEQSGATQLCCGAGSLLLKTVYVDGKYHNADKILRENEILRSEIA